MASANKKPIFVIPRGTFAGDEDRACCKVFKGRECMRARCKPKAASDTGIREEHLPPRKRLLLRFERSQAVAAAATAKEKEKKAKEEASLEKEEELEEGEIRSADVMTKGKRAPRRKRADAP